MKEKIKVTDLRNIPETLLIPLYYRSLLATEQPSLINGQYDLDIVNRINYDFSKFPADNRSLIGIASRTHILDKVTGEWLRNNPGGIIVNIGAGLDTRPLRFPQARWYNIDLPESIAVREKLIMIDETNIPQSAFDYSWMEKLPQKKNILFICEAVLMFFPEETVRSLFTAIASRFNNSLFAFETIPPLMEKKTKMNGNPLKWANEDLNELEKWHENIHVRDIYYLPDYFPARWEKAYHSMLNILPDLRKGFKVGVVAIG